MGQMRLKQLIVEMLNEAQNTLSADVSEIMLGYYLLGEKWGGFQDSSTAKSVITTRKKQITPEEFETQKKRAKVMADEVLKWAPANGFNGSPVAVWWTARPGILSKAVGYDVDSKKNPTDTLVKFSDGSFLGLSAKSTKKSGDIGFKNPGLGSLSKELGVDLSEYIFEMEHEAIKRYELPESQIERDKLIRSNPKIREKTEKVGNKVLTTLRNALFRVYKENFNNETMAEHIRSTWMDAQGGQPYWVKITGRGCSADKKLCTASVIDPMNNDKLKALSENRVSMTPLKTNSIGFHVGDEKIMIIRVKYKGLKLASSIKLSGDPW